MEHDVNAGQSHPPGQGDDPDLREWLEGTWGPARAGRPERREVFETPSGLARGPLYGGAADGGFPG
ncbi:MAG: hypothetical protein VYE81_05760, partial [Planctomycetota bacterium]|nr:hypothetical protein [Planctomycetota bacterium]